jgi:hypothetical protein
MDNLRILFEPMITPLAADGQLALLAASPRRAHDLGDVNRSAARGIGHRQQSVFAANLSQAEVRRLMN